MLTLFAKVHLVDPLQNATYQSLRQLRRMAEQRLEAYAEVERVWHRYANGELDVRRSGPPGSGKHLTLLRVKDGCFWTCWMVQKAGVCTEAGRACGLRNGEGRAIGVPR